MATIVKHPATFAYANNSMPLVFDINQTAAFASFIFDASAGVPGYGATIDLYFDSELVAYQYKYATFLDFYNDVASNYLIKKYFKTTFQNNIISLIAYENVALGVSIGKSPNFSPCLATATEGGMVETRILLGIDTNQNGVFVPTTFDKSHLCLADGRASFNIAPAFVFPPFDFPSEDFTSFLPFITKALEYRLRYAVQTPNGTSQSLNSLTSLFAINGAFPSNYENSILHPSNFLTASPRYLISRDDEPRFLSIIAIDNLYNLRLEIIAYDYTNAPHVVNIDLSDIVKGDLLHIPIGYNAINLHNHTAAPFYKYALWVSYTLNSEAENTEIFTIECDRAVRHNYKTFLFTNSRGGVDTLSFQGDTEARATIEKLDLLKTVGSLYQIDSTDRQITYQFEQFTGYYDDYQLFCYLEELLLAKQVWIYENGNLTPVEIISTDFDKGNEKETLWSASFQYQLKSNDVASNIAFASQITGNATTIEISEPLLVTIADNNSEIE